MPSLKECVKDLADMNCRGEPLKLCRKYYSPNVTMNSNGELFAKSMEEAFKKQKEFVDNIKESNIKLISCDTNNETNQAVLIFNYDMTTKDGKQLTFTGKHSQLWENNQILNEDFETM